MMYLGCHEVISAGEDVGKRDTCVLLLGVVNCSVIQKKEVSSSVLKIKLLYNPAISLWVIVRGEEIIISKRYLYLSSIHCRIF